MAGGTISDLLGSFLFVVGLKEKKKRKAKTGENRWEREREEPEMQRKK